MNKLSPISKSVKLLCLGATLSAPTHIAVAQDNAVEKIQVTGSRILREGTIAPSPVSVVTGEELVNTGALNIGEALNKMPSLKPTYGMQNSGRYIGTSGLNILDLRGMGTDRTLVLVNGKRHVSSNAGTASVDTNTIPTAWVERVEVITGGASAVYGADAVTGVVNFILKEDIDGFTASATRGEAQHSDYANDKLSISFGRDFMDGRGNFGISYEYASQNRLNALDNEFTNGAYRELSNPNQDASNKDALDNPDRLMFENAGIFAINEAGAYKLAGNWYTFDENGATRPIQIDGVVDGIGCSNCEYVNLRKFTDVQPEFDRHIVNFKTNYEINDDTLVYFEGKYAKTESEDWGQPSFFYFGSGIEITRDNAFLDPTTAALMDRNSLDSITVNRFNTDIGRRFELNTRETTRFVGGIKGLVAQYWDYEVYVNSGITELERANHNNLIKPNFRAATDAIKDAQGNIICRDEIARANGCVAMDIMGINRPSQASIDYVNTVSVGHSKIEQLNVGGTLANAAIYELPAGPVGVAFGLEYREEKSRTSEDDNAKSGDTFFNALGEDVGQFEVAEVFAETSLPLLGDLPFVDTLTLEVAARYADYSTIGDVVSWKAGLDWQVNDELRVRSTLSEALRAPNIGELYGALGENFYSIDDPCRVKYLNEVTGDAKAKRVANCAALGVPSGFDNPYDESRIKGTSGGNRALKGEESTSYTIGAVFTPTYIDGLSITVDYWNIQLDDAIDTILAQQIVERCVDADSINNQYCALITRNNEGKITDLRDIVLNIASQQASGIDFEVNYDIKTDVGNFKTRLMATRLIERKSFPFQEESHTFEEYAGVDSEPVWQGTFDLNYDFESYFASLRVRYLERTNRFRADELAKNPNFSNFMAYPSYVVSDITVGYHFDMGVTVKFGIDNVFNKAPIKYVTGTTDASGSYDNIGRFGYAQISYKF
ncbi:TonB-dependent receptor domain-containing protein [Pseudoalteromonas sp. T1lg23B]|uniref:TonB-dependent receptor domain-containing protein n=1 Tax=Pseudoalteromonas sp. T1lg23B TaxID=2077097 RepID=UPI000CF605CD|nr:TonB-dependent receptor [Pseudoalteromonas sp. T1lg23B]